MRIVVSGMVSLALASTLMAEKQAGPGTIEADARAAFVQSDDGTNNMNALGAGINVLYKQKLNDAYSIGAGFGIGVPVLESEKKAAAGVLLVEEGGTSSGTFFSFNQLHVHYAKGDEDALIGRFSADTPLAGSDDNYRLNKNAFQGVFATFKNTMDNLIFAGGYIDSFSGIDSYTLNTDGSTAKGSFASMSDAAFGMAGFNKDAISNSGVLTAAALYSNELNGINAQGWVYYMPTVDIGASSGGFNAFYLDGEYTQLTVGDGISLIPALQYISLSFGGDFSGFSHNIVGAKVDASNLPVNGLEATVAVNSVTGDGSVMNVWGAYPEFSGGSEVFLTGLSDATTIKIGGTYDISKQLENSKAKAAVYSHSGDMNGVSYSATILEAGMEYLMPKENIKADAAIVVGNGDNETTMLVLKGTYTF